MTAKTYQTTLLIRGDAKNAVREVQLTRGELEKLTGVQTKNVPVSQRMSQAFLKANTNVGKLTRNLQGFGGLLGAIGVTAFAKKTLDSADSLASMRGQLKLVTDSQDELNQVYSRALQLSNDTGQATESTVNLYARMARSTEELKLTQDQLFTITEAVNQSFVVSGAATQEAASATLQLSQGLAAGALRGEELNSVMENSPRLARAIADGLGVTIGQLREMGSQGELTAEAVTGALLATADDINAEFNEMPMTIGRSMQALSNSINDALGDVDTGPLTKEVNEAQKLLADPSFRSALNDLAAALLKVTSGFVKTLAEGVKFGKWIGEEFARQIHGVAADDLPGLEQALYKAQKELAWWEEQGTGSAKRIETLNKEIAELTALIEFSTPAVEKQTDAVLDMAEVSVTAERQTMDLVRAQWALDEVLRQGSATIDDAKGRYKALQGVHAENDDILKDLAESAQKAEEDMMKLALAGDPVAAAIERTGERMDDTFAGFFKSMIRDGKASFDDLKSVALDTLSEIIYAFARNRVLLSVGMGGSSAGAAASTGLSGGISGIGSSLMSGIGSFGSGVYNTIGDAASFLADLGVPGMDSLSVSSYGKGMTNTSLSTLGNIGAGLAGGLLGDAVFGPTSGIGSTLGGIAGSFIPIPYLGTAIGSFLGSGLESLLTGKPSDKTGTALLNLSSGSYDIGGLSGDKYSQENRDAAGELAEQFAAFAGVLGGSTGSLDIGVGNRDGLRLDGRDYGSDIDGFLEAGFDKIIDGATQLDPALRDLIKSFDGTAEELAVFAASMVGLSDAANVNVVQMARDSWAALTDEANTATSSYLAQADAVRELVANFDGSAASAQNLNTALATNRDIAYQLSLAILQTSDQIRSLTSDTVTYFQESVMSDAELRESRLSRRDDLVNELRTLTDASAISETVAQIDALNKQIFDALTPEQQAANVDAWVARSERVNEIAQARLEQSLQEIEQSQTDINAELGELLTQGAQQMTDASVQFATGSAQFAQWVETLVTQGIRVNLSGLGSEVTA